MALDHGLLARMVAPLLATLPRFAQLTLPERDEVVRIALGLNSHDCATATNRPLESVRARRADVYAKLRVSGAAELTRLLLLCALAVTASPVERREPEPIRRTAVGG